MLNLINTFANLNNNNLPAIKPQASGKTVGQIWQERSDKHFRILTTGGRVRKLVYRLTGL